MSTVPPDPPSDALEAPRPSDALAEAIAEAWTVLSRAHPTWTLTREAFVQGIYARLVAAEVDPAGQITTLSRLAMDDLFHVIACLGGCKVAIDAFFRRYDGVLAKACRRHLFAGLAYDDVVQDVRTSLIVVMGANGGQPDLASYGGRGSLKGWLGTVVQRRARDHARRADARRRNLPPSPPVERDREGHVAERDVAITVVGLLREALDKLPPEVRTLVQKRFRDAMNQHEIAEEQGVAVSTISRRLQAASKAIRAEVLHRARTEHGLTIHDLMSAQDALAREIDLGDLMTGLQWLIHLLSIGRLGVSDA